MSEAMKNFRISPMEALVVTGHTDKVSPDWKQLISFATNR